MAKAVNLALRTVSLDAMATSPPTGAEAVREGIVEKIDETMMLDELPKGPDEAPVPLADNAVVRRFLDELAERIRFAEVKGERRPHADVGCGMISSRSLTENIATAVLCRHCS